VISTEIMGGAKEIGMGRISQSSSLAQFFVAFMDQLRVGFF
jgi:hypothetical protein